MNFSGNFLMSHFFIMHRKKEHAMKVVFTLKLLFIFSFILHAQPPVLHIHIVSHNEPTDNIESSVFVFNKFKNNTLKMAEIVEEKNVKWNLQTSDGFVLGALQYQNAGTNTTDIFETLANPPYRDNIEIDPRSKNKGGRNIADQWYLLDSCGANPTAHLGGFIYSSSNPSIQPIDWLAYRKPIKGNIYKNYWQCSLLTGAGSYPPHTNDLHDFGIFKPDTTNNFYHHNPDKNLWCIGTGCAPLLDSLDDEQLILDLIRGQLDSIQKGLWPQDKFYVTRIMTNQREYGPMFFSKISRLIDSLNLIPTDQLKWATIGETFEAFKEWQMQNDQEYSQWQCGETLTSNENVDPDVKMVVSPNPFLDELNVVLPEEKLYETSIYNAAGEKVYCQYKAGFFSIDTSTFPVGMYFMLIGGKVSKLIKIY